MKSPQSEASSSPDVHRQNIMRELSRLIEHLKADMRRVDEPRFRGLLEKSAEVLKSLRSLFERYESSERQGRSTPSPARRSGKEQPRTSATKGKSAAQARAVTSSTPQRAKAKKSASRKEKMTTLTGEAAQKRATLMAASESNVAAPKPVDPAAIAALAEQQRKEARAPKMPGGPAAPKPLPPQSGKPVWSQPHSS